jgi:hypothetical protein
VGWLRGKKRKKGREARLEKKKGCREEKKRKGNERTFKNHDNNF